MDNWLRVGAEIKYLVFLALTVQGVYRSEGGGAGCNVTPHLRFT